MNVSMRMLFSYCLSMGYDFKGELIGIKGAFLNNYKKHIYLFLLVSTLGLVYISFQKYSCNHIL